MKFKFPIKMGHNPENLIKKCGYGKWHDVKFDKISFTRKLANNNYPRFHVYLTDFENSFEVDLHLDQKQESYGVGHAHSGEYDGDTVLAEAQRITGAIKKVYGM
ncbi:hypothetical protein HN958_02115 [Candidatus Falkowbacteria bacterium]|jgi:hypothetical protein|nr:hypothetical protein [Candidatus Falkowbacteria bacterium]MBT7007279.1 hypothetical protein [Candidatus Falkowbacteria bacterium]